MITRRWRSVVLGSIAAAGLILSGCSAARHAEPTGHATAGGVTVTITLLPGTSDRRKLEVTFRPQQPGFHIYSTDLPAHGIDGLGIPTKIAVQGDLTAVGKPTANLAIRLLRPAGLQVEIPVYPNGPVTFTLPVRQTGHQQRR